MRPCLSNNNDLMLIYTFLFYNLLPFGNEDLFFKISSLYYKYNGELTEEPLKQRIYADKNSAQSYKFEVPDFIFFNLLFNEFNLWYNDK